MNSSDIVYSEGCNLYLNSFMDPLSFAKARFSEQIKTPAVLLKKNGNGWETLEWIFDQTQDDHEDSGNTVVLKGTAFKGRTLLSVLDSPCTDSSQMRQKQEFGLCVIDALNFAIKNKIRGVQNIGAGGIFISEKKDRILFMPKLFYTNAAVCAGDFIFSKAQGRFINDQLKTFKSINFMQSVIAYKILTETYPFESENTVNRRNDILDRNFIPLEYLINGINKKLSDFMTEALSAQQESYTKKYAQENPIFFPIEIFSDECDRSFTKDRTQKFSDKKFTERKNKFMQKTNCRIKTKRAFRKHRTLISVISTVAIIGAVVAGSIVNSNLKKPSTKGLTALQTVNAYYTAMNKLDITLAANVSKGKSMSYNNNIISNIYVASKSRSMYDPRVEVKPFVQWLCYNNTDANICGLSQLEIYDSDGIKSNGILYQQTCRKKDKVPFVTQENGILLKDGDIKNFTSTYYTVLTETEDKITVTQTQDNIQVTYKKNKWFVTDIQSQRSESVVLKKEFVDYYSLAIEEAENDIFTVIKILEKKYPWVPFKNEIEQAFDFLKDEKFW